MENLGVDAKLLIAQLLNFGLFYFIFNKFVAKPFLKFIHLEKVKDQERQKELERIKKREEELVLEEKKAKDMMRAEFTKIIEKAKREAQKVKEELIAQARKEAHEVEEKAKKQIQEEREEMHTAMKEKIAELSILIVKKGLGEFFTEEMQKEITQNILKNLSR